LGIFGDFLSLLMPKLLVMADDLTGANDIGVQFAKKAVASFVTVDLDADLRQLFQDFEVVVVDTESRHVGPSEAQRRIFSLASRARQAGINYFYKKTDSTLRGNVGAELEALLQASGKSTMCFVPALPQLGRTTRLGTQYVGGKPLHETVFARDPRNPINESQVGKILARQSTLPMHVITIEALPSFHECVRPGIAIFDAETGADLRKVAETITRAGALQVLAAPAGFAEYLPELLEFRKTERHFAKYGPPILVINGSLNEVSLQQMVHAARSGFSEGRLSPELLVRADGPDSALADLLIEKTAELLAHDQDVTLQSVSNPDEVRAFVEMAASCGLSAAELHDRVAHNTGRLVGRILEKAGLKLLIVFGGDTLIGIAKELGWSGFLPCEELLPGITVSRVAPFHKPTPSPLPGGEPATRVSNATPLLGGARGGSVVAMHVEENVATADQLVLISKSGGFGAEDVLTSLREIVKKRIKC
jgi:uncharacterized protein YgbK (DUF1537 family)